MNKKNNTIWSTRFKNQLSGFFQDIGSSLDVDKRLYAEDIFASIIHVQMLSKQKIITTRQSKKIIIGLKKIKKEIDKNKFKFNKKYEDIHLNIEKRLFSLIGKEAGYLHIARSRNDQVVTDFKLWIKNSNKLIINNINKTIKEFIRKAEKNTSTVMPGFTHLKNAQTISFAHYLLACVEMLNRDKERFISNIKHMDECPLGAAALAGTSYKIDRFYTSKKLNFKNPTKNSLDTVSDRDFALDFLSSSAICAMHISRIAEDFVIWNSDVFQLITFKDSLLTGSSIMPQKKNPDPVELIRGKAANNFGKLQSMLSIMKSLPVSYYKDMQDDKSLVFESFDTLLNSLIVLKELIKNIIPNKKRMLSLAKQGFTTATDFADYLVQKKGFSFREAYKISAKLVNYAEKNKKTLDELTHTEVKKFVKNIDANVIKVFNVINSMNSKTSYGGTSEKNVKKMIKIYKRGLNV
tara:strand:- start:16160 stop:17551 length:1392 start_codon:yes stop_codon:yes gene_type:complete